MKLGEALSFRAKQAQHLNDLRGRIKNSALVQEGDEPPEDLDALLTEFDDASAEHRDLVLRINRTNIETTTEDGRTLLELLGEREHLRRRRTAMQDAVDAATVDVRGYGRYSRSEVRYVPTIESFTEFHQSVENVTGDIAVLDARIQETNWKTDLVGDDELPVADESE